MMRNLNPLDSQICIDRYRRIANRKRGTRRATLLGLEPHIQNRYNQYFQSIPNLQLVNSVTYPTDQDKVLRHCYDVKTSALEELIVEISTAQHLDYGNKCQYCGIGISDSIDHYMPQESFPDFNVLAINLIPCCPTCNSIKQSNWVHNGNRLFINLYFDILPNTRYLFATVNYNIGDNVPIVDFQLRNNGGINAQLFSIIQEHYSRLDLFNRFKEVMNQEVITPLQNILRYTHSPNLSIDQKRVIVFNHSNNVLRRQFGVNYWGAALADALAVSQEFYNTL